MIFLHPKEAATRVRAPIISGLRMFSKIIVMGKCSAFVLEINSVSISCLSKIAGNENKMIFNYFGWKTIIPIILVINTLLL